MSSKYFHFDAKYKIFKKLPCSCNYAVTILCLYENRICTQQSFFWQQNANALFFKQIPVIRTDALNC